VAVSTEVDVFLTVLADAESALRGNEDDRQWALDVPVFCLREDVASSDELAEFLSENDEVAKRFDAVVAAAKEIASMRADA
jgi:hypothetical protein